MKRPIRLYVQPSHPYHRFNFTRALGILKGRRDGLTYAELARRYGITHQRIQQIYRQVLWRGGMAYLRKNMRA